jgi:hypothetical protein
MRGMSHSGGDNDSTHAGHGRRDDR